MRSDRGIASQKKGYFMAFNERFIKTQKKGTLAIKQLWIDRATGVNYLFHLDGCGGGLTMLLDNNEKPIVTPPDELEKISRNNW